MNLSLLNIQSAHVDSSCD